MKLNRFIEHTSLKPTATTDEIKQLCEQAMDYDFYGVCVNGCYVKAASKYLKQNDIKIVSVVGFPLGAASAESKIFEAKTAIEHGADEIDMVMNIGFLKSGKTEAVQKEIENVKNAIGSKTLKVILETCFLSEAEIRTACQLALSAGADFVKTSTGFGTGGATEKAVQIMAEEVGTKMKIKASGGIRDAETAKKYIDLGVSRIGTSSGINIVSEI